MSKDSKIEDLMILNKSESIIENEYFTVFSNKEFKSIICVCKQSYIVTEHFIKTFQEIEKWIESRDYTKFIFDKRELRAFHQPTMEWYFIEWKQSVYDKGIKHHRKLLPNQEWFKQCVEAGKALIVKNNPSFNIEKYDIQYFNNLTDAIEN